MNGWIRADGSLDERFVASREILYKGINGVGVERIRLRSGESYIWKPETSEGQYARETWVYERILPRLGGLAGSETVYPRLIASCDGGGDPLRSWMLFEDLGDLSHVFDERTAGVLIERIAGWHWADGALSRAVLAEEKGGAIPPLGPKPEIERMAADIARSLEAAGGAAVAGDEVAPASEEAREPERGAALLAKLSGVLRGSEWTGACVLSHGDLHLGNYAMTRGGLRVLDWEHVHLNSPYWDLYHVIDLSHPAFPKQAGSGSRERLLGEYVRTAARYGAGIDAASFLRGYYAFSAIFSWWMLLLVEQDLRRGGDAPWPAAALLAQREESQGNFGQCVASLAAER